MDISAAGPIAQAYYNRLECLATEPDLRQDLYWQDWVTGAVMDVGWADYKRSQGLVDNAAHIDRTHEAMSRSWKGIAEFAEALADELTISGRRAFNLLGSASSRSSQY